MTVVPEATAAPGLTRPAAPASQAAPPESEARERLRAIGRYLRRNPSFIVGVALIIGLLLFSTIGSMTWDLQRMRPLSVRPLQSPSWALPFGSDKQGRDLFAVIVAGTPLTLKIGLIAGFLGISIGTILGFIAAYYGGLTDTIIRGVVDIGLSVPGLLVLVIIAVTIRTSITTDQLALVIACLAWLAPTRTVRSQVLTMRERTWVQVARLSGMQGWEVIVKEMLPNLFPYLVAALVTAVSNAILASIGLEALGLGEFESPTLGMTVYWVLFNSALINGWWWWWVAPIVVLVILFVGLFMISLGLDEIANPRLRRSV